VAGGHPRREGKITAPFAGCQSGYKVFTRSKAAAPAECFPPIESGTVSPSTSSRNAPGDPQKKRRLVRVLDWPVHATLLDAGGRIAARTEGETSSSTRIRRGQGRERIQPNKNGPEELRLPRATDLIFPKWQRELFATILNEEDLRFDREGLLRTAYSLRPTYICFRLMEGADIYQIAKNCRTSVEMIEKYYAAHIKTNLDAAAINIMRPKPTKKINQPKTQNPRHLPTSETDM
jgi:hypothetical protein